MNFFEILMNFDENFHNFVSFGHFVRTKYVNVIRNKMNVIR